MGKRRRSLSPGTYEAAAQWRGENRAAKKIQRAFRGYKTRMKARKTPPYKKSQKPGQYGTYGRTLWYD
jgi:hypothetical protein